MGKTRDWLERYHFVVSTLALGLKINFDQPIKRMEFQTLAKIKWLPVSLQTRKHAKYDVTNRGDNQALAGAILFCGEHPGPRFEGKF